MVEVQIRHRRNVPDRLRLERFKRSPDLGPRVLFFSGGSALRPLCRELVRHTHNSVHLITPFDSGGSSAKLRQAFRMPAVGDIRNRLMSLADQSLLGNPETFALFAHRFPKDAPPEVLKAALDSMARGRHKLVASVPGPLRKIIRTFLYDIIGKLPADFDLRGASVGNLILASGYLTHRRHLDPVIHLFTMLAKVLGTVRPVVNADLELAVELDNGRTIVGQHLMTGKEADAPESPIRSVRLVRSQSDPTPVTVPIREKIATLIRNADLICYPIGSFYSSLIANLLPDGVSEAIMRARCPKVFIPNVGHDPELLGHDPQLQVERLLHYLRPRGGEVSDVLNFILTDSRNQAYPGKLDKKRLAAYGPEVLDLPMTSPETPDRLDPVLLTDALLSLA